MARLHSKKHGKSGSKKPAQKVAPEWVEYPAHEIEEMVLKFYKEGTSPTAIGMHLRDNYGIPSVRNITKKTVVQIIKAANLKIEYPDDMMSLIKRAVRMRRHMAENKQDKHNKVKLTHVESKIGRLAKYYTGNGTLPAGWKYDPEKAALLVK